MKYSISKILIITSVIIFSGCAASYKPINPPTLNYNSHEFQDGIGLSYKYDVLREKGNKKYANKETKKGVKLIAVKVTNNTDTIIRIGKDVAFYSGQNRLVPMEPIAIKESIKQNVPGYIPYFLLSFLKLTYTETNNGMVTEQNVIPIGVVLGPTIAIGNMTMAGSSNKNMLNELNEYNLLDREIQKGETAYGIIGFRDLGYSPISVKIIR